MTFDWEDKKLVQYLNSVIDSSDTILMGRKMTDEFVNYWSNALKNPKSPEYSFAKKMIDVPKVVFTKTLREVGRYLKLKEIDVTPCEDGITIHHYLPEMATKPQSSKTGSAA